MHIKKLMIDFYSRHKDHTIVQIMNKLYSKEYGFPYDYLARKRLRKWKNNTHPKTKSPTVCFIVTDPSIWNKLEPVYNEMRASNSFNVKMLCVDNIFDDETESTYDYFLKRNYDCVSSKIVKSNGKVQLFDLKKMDVDYVFYGQPYNNYLPKKYRTYEVSKYAKVCTMFYGINLSWTFLNLHSKNFYRDVYKCYAVVPEEIEHNRKMFPKSYKENLQDTKYLGFPAFAQFISKKNEKSDSFSFSKNDMKFIWTPRWTTDKKIGGSNFFNYKDVLIEYALNHSEVDFLFRPHPMALDNFIATGEMSQQEVDEFRGMCEKTPNLGLDTQKQYDSTFWNSSALITDISSVVVEYFITEKPIIYCENSSSKQDYLSYFADIMNSFYIVHNDEELISAINMLSAGDDPKAEERKMLKNKWFGTDLEGASKRIVEDLLYDYSK